MSILVNIIDTSVDLIQVDDDITEEINRLMVERGISVKTIHRRFVTKRDHFAELPTAMTLATIRVAGYDLFAKQDGIEVDHDCGYGMTPNEKSLH